MVALAVAAALLAWSLSSRGNDNGRMTVPAVVGMPLPRARIRLHARHLVATSLHIASTRSRGTVLGQSPRAGSDVARGSIVNLVVSSGEAAVTAPTRGKVAVPAVVLEAVQNASKRLRHADLVPELSLVRSSKPAGTVVAQNPRPGRRVARGTAVRIDVSLGPKTTTRVTTAQAPAAPPGTLTVPHLVGERFDAALQELEVSVRVRSAVAYRTSARRVGTVIAQAPRPGTLIAPTARVRLTVSAGSRPTMHGVPRVVADDPHSAASTLRKAGFVPVVIRRKFVGMEKGVVLEQQPSSEQKAPFGAPVAIYVSS
jgi:serine/threonine-protein kinase